MGRWMQLGGAFAIAGAAACSVLVPSELDQCSTDGDCTKRGAAWASSVCHQGACVVGSARADTGTSGTDADADAAETPSGPWGCVGSVTWPLDSSGETYTIRNRVVDVSEKPVAGVTFVPCGKLDPECTKPAGSAVTTGADGIFTITVPRGFDGYLKLTAPAPFLAGLVVNAPVYASLDSVKDGAEPLHVLAKGDIDALLALVGGAVDDTAGHLLSISLDCEGKPAAGVSLSPSLKGPNTKGYYYEGGLPNTDALATDATGLGGFVNVPPGNVTLTGRNALGQLYAKRTVIVKAKTVTYLTSVPSP